MDRCGSGYVGVRVADKPYRTAASRRTIAAGERTS